ncbi:MAG: DUF4830 domain-containing protein [Ruminococcus albus]|uniref:DUF4830 domain-containing protein n=1 Tax=Ruminococcus sp. TaxID=41978 RepID=UPI0025E274CD|nr:DUF4830 domain-containing protein [Ruminococcus sp.]MBE6873450.1 DUF4830 domain-containing protein [Ruminococcus albus]MBQ9540746.1 DUF4830 domain-containing protein [Ruminococcus sp.]MBR0528519.1 DUF4830 domain-containing protein [Ruminococcus sp.]
MFIRTVKIKKPKVMLTVLLVIICIGLAAVFIFGLKSHTKQRMLDSEPKRQAFLSEMGWEVPEKFDEVKTVLIPEEWGEVYLEYNKLQKKQGFDLTKYKGMQVQVYSYRVMNYPSHENEDCILCHLMVCDGRLIGGDVCSTASDGFMQGLRSNS